MFSSKTTLQDMQLIRAALLGPITNPTALPIRYCIGGVTYHGIPAEWNPKSKRRIIDANMTERVYTAKVPNTPLSIRVECFEYKDFPVFEWTVYFENEGEADSPILSDFCGMDHTLPAGKHAVIYHNSGDYGQRDGMVTTEHCLDDGEPFAESSFGGRSCDRAWPYYRIVTDDIAYNVVIGWPGGWSSRTQFTENGIHMEAKQSFTNFYLKPGETVRSPRMLVMALEGGNDRAVNMWRRYYFAHLLVRSEGQALPPKHVFIYRARGIEHTAATAENQCMAIQTFIDRGQKPDLWWIDAGWYECNDPAGNPNWGLVGFRWYPDPKRFPDGMAPIGKLCKENGIDFLLWFEPERVILSTYPEDKPQEFVLKLKEPMNHPYYDASGIFNLGNPEAREMLTEMVKKVLKEGQLRVYRQDLNIEPEYFWRANEEPGREGMIENLHIQGLLQYWDDLLMDIPDLWYDSCACGGRRNDLECMRRGVPLHTTDYGYGEHPVKQTFQKGWFEWVPYFRSWAINWDDEDGTYDWMTIPGSKPGRGDFDAYAAHCAFGPATTFGNDTEPIAPDSMFDFSARMRELFKPAMAYTLNSDFFCHIPVRKSNEDYFVIQFNREDDDEGLIQVVRNTRCEEESVTIRPVTFNPEKTYVFSAPETEECFEISGAEINEKGLTFSIPKRSGRFYYYHAI